MDDAVTRAKAATAASLTTVASMAVVLAGCGSSDDGAGMPAPAPLESAVSAPDPLLGGPITDSATLQAAMLTPAELPDGYVAIPDPVRDLGLDPAPEYDSPDRSGTDPVVCADVLAPVTEQVPGAISDAVVRYSGPEFSSIDADAASFADAGAADAFTAVQETLAQCDTFTGTDADGIAVEYDLGSREQATIGDASTSVRLNTTSEGFTLTSEAVVAVVDRTVMQFVVTSQDGVDPAMFTELATVAADKIRGATPGT